MAQRERLMGPTLYRAEVGVTVLDESARRVRLSFSSETPVLRRSWFDDPWIEVLGHDPGEIDMSRLDSGAVPLLWGHDAYDRDAHIGIVEKAWTENQKGYADVRLSSRAELDAMWADVRDGIVRNVSVGYQINERTLVRTNDTGPDEYRVTRWTPVEISLVSVPADPDVGVGRSAEAGAERYTITKEERHMEPNTEPTVQTTAAPAVPVDLSAVRAEAQAQERARIAGIAESVRAAGLDESLAQQMIADGTGLDAARAEVMRKLGERPAPRLPTITPGLDQRDKMRDAAEAWILHRAHEDVAESALNGNAFRGMRLMDIARRSLDLAGVRTDGMLQGEIAQRAISHSTSDFPLIFANVLHKTLLGAYSAIPDRWRSICAVGNLSDFRPHYRYRTGSFGDLATVAESGSYTYGALSDGGRESITAATKGKLLNLSRQMIINDDLGAFVSASREMGRAAARTLEKDVFALLASNPTLSDSVALFHSTHANLNASGGSPTVALIDGARQAMASQLNVGSTDYISVLPRAWLGPLAYGSTARELNAMEFNDTANKQERRPNVVRGLFGEVIDTPRISGQVWYMFADPADEPVLEVGFLDGVQTPYAEMQNGFEQDGVVWKIRYDYGVAAVGYRGAYKVTW